MVQSQQLGKVLELKFVEQAIEDYPELQPVHITEDDILNLKHGTDVLLKIGEQVLAVGLTMRDDLSKLVKDVEKASRRWDWYVQIVIRGKKWETAFDNALDAINHEIRGLMLQEKAGFYVVYANSQNAVIDCFNSRAPKTRGY